MSKPFSDMPNISPVQFKHIGTESFARSEATHPPKILLLYGSVRTRSFSRLVAEEAARILQAFGAKTRIFNPSGLPLPDDADDDPPNDVSFLRTS
ncbi:NADPH-dependent FMN reductase [Oceanospirillum sp.]|uniref:NADPH-dependent FMN reductase n=1 Tax=Oceanospirillum sp. TaxID=2021254 RepID=UPI003A957BB4